MIQAVKIIIIWFSVLIFFTFFALCLDSFFDFDIISPLYAEGTDSEGSDLEGTDSQGTYVESTGLEGSDLEGDITKDQLDNTLTDKNNEIKAKIQKAEDDDADGHWDWGDSGPYYIFKHHRKYLKSDVKSISKQIKKLPEGNVDREKASKIMERIRKLDSIRPEQNPISRFMDKLRKK